MHIHTIRTRRKGKVYKSHLLRQSYRDGGKVKKCTLAVLSALPEPVIGLLERALRGDRLLTLTQAEVHKVSKSLRCALRGGAVDVTAPRNVTIQSSRMRGAVVACTVCHGAKTMRTFGITWRWGRWSRRFGR